MSAQRIKHPVKDAKLIKYFQKYLRKLSQEIIRNLPISKTKQCFLTGELSTKRNRLVKHHLQSFTLIMLETFRNVENNGLDPYSFIENKIKTVWLDEVLNGEYKKSRTKKFILMCESHRNILENIILEFTKVHNKYPLVKIQEKLHKKYHSLYLTYSCNVSTFAEYFNIPEEELWLLSTPEKKQLK